MVFVSAGSREWAARAARCALALGLLALPLAAGTIEVPATGAAEAPVAACRLTFRLAVEKGSGVEAAKEFAATRARVDKAFAQLEIDGLEVAGSGTAFEYFDRVDDPFGGVQIVNGRRVAPDTTRLVKVSEEISVRLPVAAEGGDGAGSGAGLIERIARVVDAAEEVGLAPVGPPPLPNLRVQPQPQQNDAPTLFSLEVADRDALRHEAERAAIEEARRRAIRLAEAAGVVLGEVQIVRVTRTAPLASADGSLRRARQEVDITVSFLTR